MTTTQTSVQPRNFIGGRWLSIDGDAIQSHNPAQPDQVIWAGVPDWAARPIDERIEFLQQWKATTDKHAEELAGLICDEMGKTMSETRFEAKALGGKVDITLDDVSMNRVREYEVGVTQSRAGYCRYKPHGVMAVIAPFNFPAHLANGHFVPALLMGNTIVLKPSEKTPAVGQKLAEMMEEAGAPPGVFNLVQGAGDIAAKLVSHDGIDGILFTGSWPVGRKILEANLDRPGRIVALEMGGNNPAVVMNDANFKQAVVECVRASFSTTGQRCTCTRRIIVQSGIADRFITAFAKTASTLVVAPGRSESPVFMGPLVTEDAANAAMEFQRDLVEQGGKVILESTRPEMPGHFVSPGIIEVDRFTIERDRESFAPLAQISVVESLDEAIEQANATEYGLASSIFTADDSAYERFFREVNSGCINRNCGTAGASSKLPIFGPRHRNSSITTSLKETEDSCTGENN